MQHAMHLVVRKGNGGVRKGGDIPGGNHAFVGGVGAGTGKALTWRWVGRKWMRMLLFSLIESCTFLLHNHVFLVSKYYVEG